MSDLARSVLQSLPLALLMKLDVNITLVIGPTTPPPGKWNCRIAIMRQHADYCNGREVPNYSVEATSETIEDAVAKAFRKFQSDMKA